VVQAAEDRRRRDSAARVWPADIVTRDDAALHYAEMRADLKKRGTMIGANDLFIAAQARPRV
jgi:predicted nucleic acid-binding protein